MSIRVLGDIGVIQGSQDELSRTHVLGGAQGAPVGCGAVGGGNCVDGKARPGDAVFARVLDEREGAVFDGEGCRGRGGEEPAGGGCCGSETGAAAGLDLRLGVLIARREGAMVDGWMWVGCVMMR